MLDFFRVTPKKRNVRLKGKHGVIYSNPPTFKKIFFYFGNFFFVGSLLYLTYLYMPLFAAIANYEFLKVSARDGAKPTPSLIAAVPTKIITTPTSLPIQPETPSPTLTPTPIRDNEYTIAISKIGAKAKVVSDVSPFNKTEYLKVLSENVVAQAKGTSFPGEGAGRSTYIFAHSTQQGFNVVRKNAVFYLLGELANDDVIDIHRNGEDFKYRVYDKKIINASEIQYLSYKEPDKEVLILQTCWPIGTDWKRLLIFAKRE